MFRFAWRDQAQSESYCDGITRRSFLQVGIAGMALVGLPTILRAKESWSQAGNASKDTAVILLWLDGGPRHQQSLLGVVP